MIPTSIKWNGMNRAILSAENAPGKQVKSNTMRKMSQT
jgi:hypothetical protein